MKTKYNSQAEWVEVGNIRFYARSQWEANYARYLEWLRENGNILHWAHEPETFTWLSRYGNRVLYKPDFLVLENDHFSKTYYEVKGHMDRRSKSKLEGFAKHYPEHKLVVIGKDWFAKNTKKLKGLVQGWE